MPDGLRVRGTVVVVGLAVLGVYGRVLDAPFVFDDEASITTNSSIVRLRPLLGDAAPPGHSLRGP